MVKHTWVYSASRENKSMKMELYSSQELVNVTKKKTKQNVTQQPLSDGEIQTDYKHTSLQQCQRKVCQSQIHNHPDWNYWSCWQEQRLGHLGHHHHHHYMLDHHHHYMTHRNLRLRHLTFWSGKAVEVKTLIICKRTFAKIKKSKYTTLSYHHP